MASLGIKSGHLSDKSSHDADADDQDPDCLLFYMLVVTHVGQIQ